MDKQEELHTREANLLEQMAEVQREIQAELGALDLRVYRQRLAETGLTKQWTELQAEIGKLKPRSTIQTCRRSGFRWSKSYIRHVLSTSWDLSNPKPEDYPFYNDD